MRYHTLLSSFVKRGVKITYLINDGVIILEKCRLCTYFTENRASSKTFGNKLKIVTKKTG